jgi:hypothetical protein
MMIDFIYNSMDILNQAYLVHHVPLTNSWQDILLSATIMVFKLNYTIVKRSASVATQKHIHKYGGKLL